MHALLRRRGASVGRCALFTVSAGASMYVCVRRRFVQLSRALRDDAMLLGGGGQGGARQPVVDGKKPCVHAALKDVLPLPNTSFFIAATSAIGIFRALASRSPAPPTPVPRPPRPCVSTAARSSESSSSSIKSSPASAEFMARAGGDLPTHSGFRVGGTSCATRTAGAVVGRDTAAIGATALPCRVLGGDAGVWDGDAGAATLDAPALSTAAAVAFADKYSARTSRQLLRAASPLSLFLLSGRSMPSVLASSVLLLIASGPTETGCAAGRGAVRSVAAHRSRRSTRALPAVGRKHRKRHLWAYPH